MLVAFVDARILATVEQAQFEEVGADSLDHAVVADGATFEGEADGFARHGEGAQGELDFHAVAFGANIGAPGSDAAFPPKHSVQGDDDVFAARFDADPFFADHFELAFVGLHVGGADADGAADLREEAVVEGDGGVLDAGNLAGVLFHIPGAFGGEARLNVS